jgi:hypothetical protein
MFQAKAGVGEGGYGREDLVRVDEGPEAMKEKKIYVHVLSTRLGAPRC